MPGPSTIYLPNQTLLNIVPLSGSTGLVLTPYSARGLTQTLEPINNAQWVQRDLNGNLLNLVDPRFLKYNSTISCRDTETPTFDNTWVGEVCEVWCCIELGYPVGGAPQRNAVAGSTRSYGGFNYYRPILIMMVLEVNTSFAEYPATYTWQAKLSEV